MVRRDGCGAAGRGGRPDLEASGRREAWRRSDVVAHMPDGVGWAKGGPQSNKRMHATRDTRDFIYNPSCGRARDAWRWAAGRGTQSSKVGGPGRVRKRVASNESGLVQFPSGRRWSRVASVARSALFRRRVAAQQANAPDRRHEGFHAPRKMRGGG